MTIPKQHLQQLVRDTNSVEQARTRLDTMLSRQAQSIVLVYSSGEISMRDVAAMANVSHQRIAQLIAMHGDQTLIDRAGDE